jgi:hypothetical protein
MANPKSLRISELIAELEMIRQKHGNVPVYLATDEEGNSYGSLAGRSIEFVSDTKPSVIAGSTKQPCVILYPWEPIYDFE